MAECWDKLAPLFQFTAGRGCFWMRCLIGVRSMRPYGRSGSRARRDRSLSGVAMEGAERQGLEIRWQVAGATRETRMATAWRATFMKTAERRLMCRNDWR